MGQCQCGDPQRKCRNTEGKVAIVTADGAAREVAAAPATPKARVVDNTVIPTPQTHPSPGFDDSSFHYRPEDGMAPRNDTFTWMSSDMDDHH